MPRAIASAASTDVIDSLNESGAQTIFMNLNQPPRSKTCRRWNPWVLLFSWEWACRSASGPTVLQRYGPESLELGADDSLRQVDHGDGATGGNGQRTGRSQLADLLVKPAEVDDVTGEHWNLK